LSSAAAKTSQGGAGREDWQFAWRGWIMAALFAILALARARSAAPLEPAGLIMAVAGAWYRFHAGRFIPGHSNLSRLAGDALAFAGPYRFGRHPLYLSNLIGIAGLILFANCLPWWGAVVLFALACWHHAALAGTEERYLASTWGEAYLGYLRVTPKWLGRPRASNGSLAASNAESRPADLAQAWKRQGSNLLNCAASVFVLWLLAIVSR
jgi:protein-S-isoprenylcysteine O-methyltransferase Ste14